MATNDEQARRGAIVTRRWSIIPRRGGRAVILATIGAIALGNAGAAGDDPGQSSGQGSNQELTITVDDDDEHRS
jgi:hypothetical protein